MIPNSIMDKSTKGKTPRITSDKGALDAVERTKRFKPTGGVMKATSIFTIITMPKWIGSIPKGLSNGKMIGSVINIMETTSRNIPRASSKKLTIMRNTHQGKL